MVEAEGELEVNLTLKDRINFPYLLANQILTFQKAILALEYSTREIRETIEGFVHLIPDSWKDKTYEEEEKKAIKSENKDVRPIVAGRTRMSKETCIKLGIPHTEVQENFDYYSLFQAIINLLDRRGLTARRSFTEEVTGKPYTEPETNM